MIDDPVKISGLTKSDEGKTSPVALYLFELWIDGLRYGGEIPARNWEEAENAVKNFGGSVAGRSIETIMVDPCPICKGEIRKDTEHPLPLADTDEWADVLDREE